MGTSHVARLLAGALLLLPAAVSGDETEAQRAARLSAMSAEQKALLVGQKKRFEELKPAELARLRNLYEAISNDPDAAKHEETIRRYNKWLADLSSGQRAAILQITDPQERIDKIKELMRKQEEDRFQQFVELDISKADRDTVYAWLEAFIVKHEDQILSRLREDTRRRIQETPDETARRHVLIGTWQNARRYTPDMPFPAKDDFDQLYGKLSEEARKRISAGLKTDEREQRLVNLMRAAIWSRFSSPPSREELQRFYAAMKPDDPRRERLEGMEREALFRELQRMYGMERFGSRGGQRGGGRGGPGSPLPPPGDFGGGRPSQGGLPPKQP